MRIIIALAIFSQWSGNGLVSYYLTKVLDQIGIADSNTQLLINGTLQFWNLFWAVLAALLVNRLGRRPLSLGSAALMLLFYTAQSICFAQYSIRGVTSIGNIFVTFVFLFYAAFDVASVSLTISYIIEILPFDIRAKGFNVFNCVVSLALVFNQYVNPIALSHFGWKYYVSWSHLTSFHLHHLYR